MSAIIPFPINMVDTNSLLVFYFFFCKIKLARFTIFRGYSFFKIIFYSNLIDMRCLEPTRPNAVVYYHLISKVCAQNNG